MEQIKTSAKSANKVSGVSRTKASKSDSVRKIISASPEQAWHGLTKICNKISKGLAPEKKSDFFSVDGIRFHIFVRENSIDIHGTVSDYTVDNNAIMYGRAPSRFMKIFEKTEGAHKIARDAMKKFPGFQLNMDSDPLVGSDNHQITVYLELGANDVPVPAGVLKDPAALEKLIRTKINEAKAK